MELSFYTAAVGAQAQQTRMNIIANNLANINTEGYKTQSAGFVDLLYQKYYRAATRDPETGCGARVEKTDVLHTQGGLMPTVMEYDSCHSIHNDMKSGEYYKDMIAFLDERCLAVQEKSG